MLWPSKESVRFWLPLPSVPPLRVLTRYPAPGSSALMSEPPTVVSAGRLHAQADLHVQEVVLTVAIGVAPGVGEAAGEGDGVGIEVRDLIGSGGVSVLGGVDQQFFVADA